MILNNKGIVEGIGNKFSKLLGKICQLPLKLLSTEKARFVSKDYSFKIKKSVFYSARDHEEEIEEIKNNSEKGIISAKDEKYFKEKLFEEAKKYEI